MATLPEMNLAELLRHRTLGYERAPGKFDLAVVSACAILALPTSCNEHNLNDSMILS